MQTQTRMIFIDMCCGNNVICKARLDFPQYPNNVATVSDLQRER